MDTKRNALVDALRVAAALGVILGHVELSGYGALGTLLGQFLSVRISLMFFLTVIGFYLERAFLAGKQPIPGRLRSLLRVYGVWSLVYLALSFLMTVVLREEPTADFFLGKLADFFVSGTYYHFWFYPAVVYALLFIGIVKKLLGSRALTLLLPLAAVLYAVGLLGTGYLPLGQRLPGLSALYGAEAFEGVMHLCLLGFPAVVFGMAGAHMQKKISGSLLLAAAAAYVVESVLLCLVLGWREDPQMLITPPVLAVLLLCRAQSSPLPEGRGNASLCRVVSAGMYNVHPLILAVLAVLLPGLEGLWTFALCAAGSAVFGWVLYRLRNNKLIALFL